MHAIFLDRRDGLDPLALAPVVRGWRRWSPFELRSAMLSRRTAVQHERVTGEIPTKKMRISISNWRILFSCVDRSDHCASSWTQSIRVLGESRRGPITRTIYITTVPKTMRQSRVVRAVMSRIGAGHVLDIGANTGEYSLLAAAHGVSVVAADSDVAARDRSYE